MGIWAASVCNLNQPTPETQGLFSQLHPWTSPRNFREGSCKELGVNTLQPEHIHKYEVMWRVLIGYRRWLYHRRCFALSPGSSESSPAAIGPSSAGRLAEPGSCQRSHAGAAVLQPVFAPAEAAASEPASDGGTGALPSRRAGPPLGHVTCRARDLPRRKPWQRPVPAGAARPSFCEVRSGSGAGRENGAAVPRGPCRPPRAPAPRVAWCFSRGGKKKGRNS